MVTEEELAFDLNSLKALQDKRKSTINRLKEAIAAGEHAYAERNRIIEVLENAEEQTEEIRRDLPVLLNEQLKRLDNIKVIRSAIDDEEEALLHEQDIIKAIEER